MDEYIDIVDRDGNSMQKIALKSEAHKNGWYHNTIHLWLYTSDGNILLQQRSHKKTIYPLLWDVSVAGHIDAGETFIDALLRETKEEIGLQLNAEDVKQVDTRRHESEYANGIIKDYEFHQVFIAELEASLHELSPQQDEVEALKLVSFSEFEDLLEHSSSNSHFIASNTSYYEFVLQSIKTITSK